MNRPIPHTTSPQWPAHAAGRLAREVRTDSPEGCRVAIVGLADDTGVTLNHGRPGARQGPAAFREALARFGAAWDGVHDRGIDVKVYDAGDVLPADDGDEAALLETHRRVEEALAAVHRLGLVPVCVGGGHDLTLPAVTALARHVGGPVGGVNFDAHLDVRQRLGSGMPFRRLIEQRHLEPRHFVEYGLDRFANDAADLAWIRAQGARLVFAEQVLRADGRHVGGTAALAFLEPLENASGLFVSIDLDGLDSAQAPGVSALNPCGLTVRHAAELAEAAGRDGRVRELDIMELSPPHDVAGRTARVAAYLFCSFLAGFGERSR